MLLTTNDVSYQIAYDAEVSDEQIYAAGMEEWVGAVAQLWDAIGKPVEKKRLELYCKQLSIVPLQLLESGVAYAIRNNTYSTVPPIGKIWEGIRKELVSINPRGGLEDMDIADAIERWNDSMFRRAVIDMSRL